jgi:endonuclease/exonuclease/phosphatase family metal-dependent hydrolase
LSVRSKRILVGIGVFIAVVVTYRVLAVYRIRDGECPPPLTVKRIPQKLERPLRVMTYNIEGHAAFIKPKHIEEIAETINRLRPDVLAINEAHRHTWQVYFEDHVATLSRLTGMRAAFGRGYSLFGGEFGNAVLTRGTIIKTHVYDLPSTGEPRSVLEALIRVNGATINFYVTHLSAWGSIQKQSRADQLICIEKCVRDSEYPALLAGDINATPESDEVVRFLRSGTMVLAGQKLGATQKLMNERIDLIFGSREWRIRSAEVIDGGPSDHRPVVVESRE